MRGITLNILQILHYIMGPLVGAVIGYFTNYIAVKMLFLPRRPIKLFGKTLPFTPGAIPKGKDRLAKSIGDVISGHLLSHEDLSRRLLSEGAVKTVEKTAHDVLEGSIESNVTPLLPLGITYEDARERTIKAVSLSLEKTIRDMHIGDIISEHMNIYLRERLDGSILKPILDGHMMASVSRTIADGINQYADENAYDIVRKEIEKKADDIRGVSLKDLLAQGEVDEAIVTNGIKSAYENIVTNSLAGILRRFNVAGMVEKKINDMSPKELEKLVLDVTRKELNTIVSLGAVIGFVLGLVMLFV